MLICIVTRSKFKFPFGVNRAFTHFVRCCEQISGMNKWSLLEKYFMHKIMKVCDVIKKKYMLKQLSIMHSLRLCVVLEDLWET